MDFENRFSFNDAKDFPFPLSFGRSIKRKKSFSEKIFKGAAYSTLKLRKFMNKEKTPKSISENESVTSFYDDVVPNDASSLEVDEPSKFTYDSSVISSDNVYTPVLPSNVDSYIPSPSNSSMITVRTLKSYKSPSQHKLDTFKRSEPYSSPRINIFKRRMNRNKIINDRTRSQIDPLYSSPLPYKLPLKPFLDSELPDSSPLNLHHTDDLKVSYYGQVSGKKKLARTDYSCGVSPVYNKNLIEDLIDADSESLSNIKQCKQVESPKVRTDSFSDSFSSDCSSLSGDINHEKSPTVSVTSNTSNTDFQKELLSKCIRLKKSNDPPAEATPSHKSENSPRLSKELDAIFESKLFQAQALKLKESQNSLYPNKPKISQKPSIAPKPENQNNKLGKLYPNKTVPSLDLSPKPLLSPKPSDQLKPVVPSKPINVKLKGNSELNLASKSVPEINNNYIIINGERGKYSTTIKISDTETRSNKVSENKSLNLVNTCYILNQSQNLKDLKDQLDEKSRSSISKLNVCNNDSNNLTVKDLAAAFDNVLISPKDGLKFNYRGNALLVTNRSFSDHDLSHPNTDFNTYNSISDKLAKKPLMEKNVVS